MTLRDGPRLANRQGRPTLLWDTGCSDVAMRSEGRWGPEPASLFEDWPRFWEWARNVEPGTTPAPELGQLGPPVPSPRQVFAIGLNYKAHALEAGYDTGSLPQVFTKFPTCIAGPVTKVEVSSPRLDWEVELVVAIGRRAHHITDDDGWSHVAGVMVGQDLSARDVQLAGSSPQWSLGKSFPGFGPTGPALVDPADLRNRDDLPISCSVNGQVVQQATTAQLIWSVPELIARLSSVCPLLPGDLIFTGTPAGVGNRMDPPRYLKPGDRLESSIGGVGDILVDVVEPVQRERAGEGMTLVRP